MPRAVWVPGSDHGLVWSGGAALLEGSVSPDVVERMWLLLEGGADLPGFLEGLSQACGSGLLGLPGFAIGLATEQHMHLAVRGDFCAVVADDSKQTRVEGAGVTTWTERLIAGGQEVSVSRLGTSPSAGLILVGGVVPARMLVWRRSVASFGPHRASSPTPAPNPDTVDRPPQAAEPRPMATQRAVTQPDAGDAEAGGIEPPTPNPAPTPVASAVDPGAADSGATGGRFDALWGQTVAHSVEEAAVRVQADDEVAPPPRPAEDTLSQPHTAPDTEAGSAAPPEPRELSAPPARSDVFIDAVPRHYPSPPAPVRPPVVDAMPAGDHDGETVARDELGRVSPPKPREGDGGVLASMCHEHHPNPPQSAQCRICGRAVDGGVARIPQPMIGRLHTSMGESVDLTGPVIVGRNPRASRFQGSQIPRLLSLPFAHISGSHLELRVDGWSLLAVDLNSTNGTFLRRGDAPPKRIPDSPTPLYAGDVLDFGDDVKITFEFLP